VTQIETCRIIQIQGHFRTHLNAIVHTRKHRCRFAVQHPRPTAPTCRLSLLDYNIRVISEPPYIYMVILLQLLLAGLPKAFQLVIATSTPSTRSLGSDVTILFQNDLLGECARRYLARHSLVCTLLMLQQVPLVQPLIRGLSSSPTYPHHLPHLPARLSANRSGRPGREVSILLWTIWCTKASILQAKITR
jgi:hypothetical protein